jgi:hypothetical protein
MTLSETSEIITAWTIWLGLTGQTIFLCLFATRPWRHYRITRAYFLKSLAMWAIFLRSALMLVTLGGVRSFDAVPDWVNWSAIALNGFVLWAIWYQLFALIVEMSYGDRNDPMGDNPDSRNRSGGGST